MHVLLQLMHTVIPEEHWNICITLLPSHDELNEIPDIRLEIKIELNVAFEQVIDELRRSFEEESLITACILTFENIIVSYGRLNCFIKSENSL